MKKVCFYVFGFPPDFSGATMQTLFFANFLKKKEYEMFFLTYSYNPENLGVSTYQGYKVFRFLRAPTYNLLKYHFKLFYHLFKERARFSIFYINGNDGQCWTIFWAVIFAKVFNKKLFVEMNMDIPGKDPLSILGTKFERLKFFAAKKVDKFISISGAITNSFEKSYPALKNIEEIFYGTNTDQFKKLETELEREGLRLKLNVPLNTKIALMCGGISRRKGIDFLLDCWEQILESYGSECLLIIVGPYDQVTEGHDRNFTDNILSRVKRPPLLGKVLLTGTVDNVNEYMQIADLFLFSSRQEGFGNVVAEAMSSSLPVVTTNLHRITSSLIEDNISGISVDFEDQMNFNDFMLEEIKDAKARSAFIRAALKIMSDEEFALQLGTNARDKVLRSFSFDAKAQKYDKLFFKG